MQTTDAKGGRPPEPVLKLVIEGQPLQPVGEPVASTIQPAREDHWDVAISGGIGLVGGVVGAVVGAWAAYHFGLKAAREAATRAEGIRSRQLRFSLTHKLGKIYSAQKDVRKACDAAVARLAEKADEAAQQGGQFLDHLSLELRPFATSLTRFTFSPEEVAEVGKCGDLAAMKIMMILDDRHNTTADLLDEYRTLKAEFEALVKDEGNFDAGGGYIQFAWTPENYRRLRPHLFKMDTLAAAILAHTTQDERDTYEVIIAISKASAKEGGDKVDIRVTDPEGRIVKVTNRGVEYVNDEDQPQEGAPI